MEEGWVQARDLEAARPGSPGSQELTVCWGVGVEGLQLRLYLHLSSVLTQDVSPPWAGFHLRLEPRT